MARRKGGANEGGSLFQETFGKNLNDKYSSLNAQVDKLIHDANSEIAGLRQRLEGLVVEKEGLERRCVELGEAFREKSRKCLQTQVRITSPIYQRVLGY